MSTTIKECIDSLTAMLKQRFPTRSLEHAFILWYVEMRFGKDARSTGGEGFFVDGANDLGIDYLVRTRTGWVVLQSKFSESTLNQPPSTADIGSFNRVIAHLSGETDDTHFKTWVADATGNRAELYREVRKSARTQRQVRFVFVTTKSAPASTLPFDMETGAEIAYLFSLFEEGFSAQYPAIQLTLRNSNATTFGSGRLLVGTGNVDELLSVMRQNRANGVAPDRLFEQNVRTYLGASAVTKGIVKTYKNSPETFFAKHNGIYLVAYKVTRKKGDTWELEYPSVINGAQTLWSLLNLDKEEKSTSAEVLIRVLETSTRQLRDSIIAATNTQRAMAPAALLAHHDSLPVLARRLDGCKVFLERQQRSWTNEMSKQLHVHRAISVKELVQWTEAALHIDRLGSLRARVSKYLDPDEATPLLAALARREQGADSARLFVSVAAGLLARRLPQKIAATSRGGASSPIGRRRRQDARIATVLFVHVIAQALGFSDTAADRVRHALATGAERSIQSALAVFFREMLDEIAEFQRGTDLELSNVFKSDELLKEFLSLWFTPAQRSRLRTLLAEWSRR